MKSTDFIYKNKAPGVQGLTLREAILPPHRPELGTTSSASLPFFTFPHMEKESWLVHGFFTRQGGVSPGFYGSLNVGWKCGDDPANVQKNLSRIGAAFGVEGNQMILTDQTHTNNVLRVGQREAGQGVVHPRSYQDVDGILTDEPGLLLVAHAADCTPLFFADPVKRAVGVAHSGWKGTVARIGGVMVEAMAKEFGSRPEDLLCGIAPSICQDCYEVGEDVARPFRQAFPGHQEEILSKKPENPNPEKSYLSLWTACRIGLEEAGVRPEHIITTDVCTCCNPQLLFSHRASQGKRGLLGAAIMIAPTETKTL